MEILGTKTRTLRGAKFQMCRSLCLKCYRNSPTIIFNSKILQGMVSRAPINRGEGQKGEEERKGEGEVASWLSGGGMDAFVFL